MEYLTKKLPFILSAVMALITAVAGLLAKKNIEYIYTGMLISIIFFGIIGFLVKAFINSNITELDKEDSFEEEKTEVKEDMKGRVIDLKADDTSNTIVDNFYEDDFSPLEVSKVIKTSLNNEK